MALALVCQGVKWISRFDGILQEIHPPLWTNCSSLNAALKKNKFWWNEQVEEAFQSLK